ncbi:MAG: tetratricopeptide repeat protein [Sneathiella sp.]|uniref:tetratricopeptide repeat protein n=1 Tax=Sneathiella sp. TaxID=1964365 RepID=UPI00300326E5
MSSKSHSRYLARISRIIVGFAAVCVFATGTLSSSIVQALDFESGWKLYQQGRFVEAYEIWEPLAESGDAKAQFNLAVLYEQGRGVDPDSAKSAYWNNQAVEAEYPPALHNLALSLLAEKKNIEAIDYLRQAAEKDFAASQYTLGKIHQFGIGIPENQDLAFQYIEMAAESGLANAQYNLGKMYRDGYGVNVDDTVSAKWFEAAANQGYGKAQNSISSKYGMGQGVAKDNVQALKWAILAARNGIIGAIQKQEFFRARMNSDDISEAEALAENFKKKT